LDIDRFGLRKLHHHERTVPYPDEPLNRG